MKSKWIIAITLVQLVCLGIVTDTRAADVISYTLVSGSTITPYFGATPIGPTELLTGNFDWIQYDCGGDDVLFCFDATRLDFESQSFSIHLNTTMNIYASSVFVDSSLTYFDEVVDLTGLGIPIGHIWSISDGSYSGPPNRPNSLSYPDEGITPVGGGLFVARLSIIAVLDSDGDGVPDDRDQCTNTTAGDVVDAEGCSIDQLVPCAGPVSGGTWKNHGMYVSAIAKTAEAFLSSGLITEDQKEAIVAAAAQSKCGVKQ